MLGFSPLFFAGDITQKGYEKKRAKLIGAYLPQPPGKNLHAVSGMSSLFGLLCFLFPDRLHCMQTFWITKTRNMANFSELLLVP